MHSLKRCIRITLYVPDSYFEDFLERVQDHIPSFGGQYDRVCWWSEPRFDMGVEQFRPRDGSCAVHGVQDQTSREKSIRLEMHTPDNKAQALDFVREILIPAHPWECPVVVLDEVEFFDTKGVRT